VDPVVINPKIQEFLGERYYLCGKYFRRPTRVSKLLHRQVWAFNNDWTGVPAGFDVHHKDHDPANNSSANLEIVPKSIHVSGHQKGHKRGVPAEARAAAAKWHGSPDGKEWHIQHYDAVKDKMHVHRSFECEQCRRVFVAQDNGTNRFCSNKCKTKSRYASGVDNEERHCVVCGMVFVANRYFKTRTCSRACSGVLSGRARRRTG
jgi:hypothetical protein